MILGSLEEVLDIPCVIIITLATVRPISQIWLAVRTRVFTEVGNRSEVAIQPLELWGKYEGIETKSVIYFEGLSTSVDFDRTPKFKVLRGDRNHRLEISTNVKHMRIWP